MHRLIGPDSDEPTKTVAYLARNRKFESISLQGRVGCELGFCKGGPAGSMTHDINAVGLAAGVVIGWHLRELTNLEAKLCEDVRHFKKATPYWTAPRGRRARNSPRISRGCWRCSAKCGADALFPRMPEHCAVTLWLRSRGRAPAAPTKSSGRSLRRRSSWLWVAQRQPTCEISGNQLCQYHALQLDR